MRPASISCVVLATLAANMVPLWPVGAMTLVENGKPKATIVVAKSALKAEADPKADALTSARGYHGGGGRPRLGQLEAFLFLTVVGKIKHAHFLCGG